jgi:hypothetical protein
MRLHGLAGDYSHKVLPVQIDREIVLPEKRFDLLHVLPPRRAHFSTSCGIAPIFPHFGQVGARLACTAALYLWSQL